MMNIYNFTERKIRGVIEDEIKKAEHSTQGEIVPMIVGESDDYPGAQWRFGIFVGIIMSLGYFVIVPEHSGYFYLALAIPMTLLGHLIGQLGFFKRFALTRSEVEEEVAQRAVTEFHRHKLSLTKARTGILIFVSLLEHRVIILADEGINDKVDKGTWDTLVNEFIKDIRDNRIVEGFCKTIRRSGEILATHFPAKPGDNRDELENHLIIKP